MPETRLKAGHRFLTDLSLGAGGEPARDFRQPLDRRARINERPALHSPFEGGRDPGARLGRNCNLGHRVTIGSGGRGERDGELLEGVPVLGDRVYVGPGACLFGPILLGDDVAIGANAVVTRSLPDGAVALGIPAQIVSSRGSFDYVQYLGMDRDVGRQANLTLLRGVGSEPRSAQPGTAPSRGAASSEK